MPLLQSTHPTSPGSCGEAGNRDGYEESARSPPRPRARGVKHHPEDTQPNRNRGQRRIQGFCSLSLDAALCLWRTTEKLGQFYPDQCPGPTPAGTPEASPCLPSSRTWPHPVTRPLVSHSSVLCMAWQSLPFGTQAYPHPMIVPGDSSVCAYIQSSRDSGRLWCPQGLGCLPRL